MGQSTPVIQSQVLQQKLCISVYALKTMQPQLARLRYSTSSGGKRLDSFLHNMYTFASCKHAAPAWPHFIKHISTVNREKWVRLSTALSFWHNNHSIVSLKGRLVFKLAGGSDTRGL